MSREPASSLAAEARAADGGQVEPVAHRGITGLPGLPAGQILLLSDIPAELDAAQAAGMRTTQLVRDAHTAPAAYPVAGTFSGVVID